MLSSRLRASATALSRTIRPTLALAQEVKCAGQAGQQARPQLTAVGTHRRQRLLEQIDRVATRQPRPPAGFLIANRSSREQLGGVQLAGQLRRRDERRKRVGRVPGPVARGAQLQQRLRPLALVLDADLERGSQALRRVVEGKRGARRARRAQVVNDRPLGAAERRCGAKMMGEVREAALGVRPDALQCLRNAEVKLGATQAREPVIERASHDLVGEAPGQPLRRELLDHPARHPLLEGGEQIRLAEIGSTADRLEPELGAGRGAELEQIRRLRSQAREPLSDQLADALRRPQGRQWLGQVEAIADDLDRPGLEEGSPQLADEESVAAGEIADRDREPVKLGPGVALGSLAEELGDLRLGEPGETHPNQVVGAAEVSQRLGKLARNVGIGVAVGHQQEQVGAPGRAR